MPGWHERTKDLVKEGKLQVVGIVQEQHPDRAALFMQWKEMTWPLLSDPYNDLKIRAVPITLLVDEHGIIRYRNPKGKDFAAFLGAQYERSEEAVQLELLPKEIGALQKLVEKDGANAPAQFALGVAYRARFDSAARQGEDFAEAIAHWKKALEINPNQYIWRRRIQQYGPRLDKPYSFYDWVKQARVEIKARGEEPVALVAEPSGAEFANSKTPSQNLASEGEHPDPEKKVAQDNLLITTRWVEVPSTNPKKKARRFHLTLLPAEGTTWTNDAGNVSFHLEVEGPVVIRDLSIPDLPEDLATAEERVIEFEVHPHENQNFPKGFKGAVFYYVCTKSDSTCKFLRQDLKFELTSP